MRPLRMRDLGIILVLVLSTLAWSGDSDLKLELESNVRTLRLGQKTTLRLRIVGAGVRRLTEHSEGIDSSNSKIGSHSTRTPVSTTICSNRSTIARAVALS